MNIKTNNVKLKVAKGIEGGNFHLIPNTNLVNKLLIYRSAKMCNTIHVRCVKTDRWLK